MVLAALVERERSGAGQYLEVPQTGAGLLAMSDVHGHRDRKSETFPLDHNQRGHAPTNALYRTFDGWVVIACYSDQEWESVRRALAIGARWPSFAEARNQRYGQSDTAQLVQAVLANCSTVMAIKAPSGGGSAMHGSRSVGASRGNGRANSALARRNRL
jgi:crotonobetainyl-CoA:carnitine CoA-transferase CaiB-like acyl-CoA transferase